MTIQETINDYSKRESRGEVSFEGILNPSEQIQQMLPLLPGTVRIFVRYPNHSPARVVSEIVNISI